MRFNLRDIFYRFITRNPPCDILGEKTSNFLWDQVLELDCLAFKHSEYFKIKELKDIQNSRVKDILAFARDNTEYWARHIGGIDKNPNITLESLPVITRDFLRNSNKKLFLSKDLSTWRTIKRLTSGTTGMPLEIFNDRMSLVRMESAVKGILGFKHNNKLIRLNMKALPSPIGKMAIFSFAGRGMNFQINYILRMFKEYKPTHLFGPTSAVLHLGQMLNEKRIKCSFELIAVAGEHLLEEDKKFLENVFQCSIRSIYASREAGGPIAYECQETDGMHINMRSFYVEILDENDSQVKDGEEGSIALTMFDNKVMPFIRYKIGDRAIIDRSFCACGRKSPRVYLRGRDMHLVRLKNGRTISLVSVVSLIRDNIKSIIQYQFVQNNPGEIIARLNSKNRISDSEKQNIIEQMTKRYASQLYIKIEQSEHIEGKNILYIDNLK